jgi:hypothetical protein
LNLARQMMHAGKGKLLLPVLFKTCEYIPRELADIHYADFREDYEKGWSMVVQSLQQWASQHGSAPHGSLKQKPEPPERSRRALLPLALVALALGYVGFKQVRLLDSPERPVAQPQPQSGSLSPTPSHVARNLPELRSQHRVRPLQTHEGEMEAGRLPVGTFGFVSPSDLPLMSRARVHASHQAGDFEVHMTVGAKLFVVGYTGEVMRRRPAAGATTQVSFSPSATQVMLRLTAISFDELRQVQIKNEQGRGFIELHLASYTTL